MAFRASVRANPRRIPSQAQDSNVPLRSTIELQRAIDDSQEWILSSPSQVQYPDGTQTSTERTPQTTGLSRLSDFGSLNTAPRSGQDEDYFVESYNDAVDDAIDDDEEVDSLDDGLHAFGEALLHQNWRHLDRSGGSVLPAHDGHGVFLASNSPIQQQIWSSEQYAPHKRLTGHIRRRSSAQKRLNLIVDQDGGQMGKERMERIERWRMEQSKVLLDEIELESRKRKKSITENPGRDILRAEDAGKDITTSNQPGPVTANQDNASAHHQELEGDESSWQRITRQVICNFMGIDQTILSAILGETLLADTSLASRSTPDRRVTTGISANLLTSYPTAPCDKREDRFFTRIARELAALFQHLSEHPGAFSTGITPVTMDYAGIPIARQSTLYHPSKSPPASRDVIESSLTTHFKPTLRDLPMPVLAANHEETWDIEDEEEPMPAQESDYWERTPDLKAVFGYLHQRFTFRRESSTSTSNPSIAISTTPDSLGRAAVIRQYHPLVSRAAHGRESRRNNLLYQHIVTSSSSLKRVASSCASLGVKKSRRAATSSSKNYWDIGGSVGSGNAIAGPGGLGAWGEV
ncbi:hypothetical protein MMC06_003972 [Schaereria dolodes]|nr:hypothetical protein [Schaereria dolodes]